MEIPKNRKEDVCRKLNFETDITKPKDVLGSEIIIVHDFFGKSKKIDKMSDIFPRTTKPSDEEL